MTWREGRHRLGWAYLFCLADLIQKHSAACLARLHWRACRKGKPLHGFRIPMHFLRTFLSKQQKPGLPKRVCNEGWRLLMKFGRFISSPLVWDNLQNDTFSDLELAFRCRNSVFRTHLDAGDTLCWQTRGESAFRKYKWHLEVLLIIMRTRSMQKSLAISMGWQRRWRPRLSFTWLRWKKPTSSLAREATNFRSQFLIFRFGWTIHLQRTWMWGGLSWSKQFAVLMLASSQGESGLVPVLTQVCPKCPQFCV